VGNRGGGAGTQVVGIREVGNRVGGTQREGNRVGGTQREGNRVGGIQREVVAMESRPEVRVESPGCPMGQQTAEAAPTAEPAASAGRAPPKRSLRRRASGQITSVSHASVSAPGFDVRFL